MSSLATSSSSPALPSRLVLRGGRVFCPASGIDRLADLEIANGRITRLGDATDGSPSPDSETSRTGRPDADEILDCTGKLILPGFVDLACQFGEPGFEEDETIASGTAAAVAGGYTTVIALPGTDPPIDTPAAVEFLRQKARAAGRCHVLPVGCVSKNRDGAELSEIGMLCAAGAVAFSDADRPIERSDLLHRALEYCGMFGRVILSHPKFPDLARGGVMHDGRVSLTLALPGMPSEAEDVAVSRDLRLAEATGGRLHLLAISTREAVELVRRAKQRGVAVTAGVRAVNLILTDERLRTFDTRYKLDPPLRSAEDVAACLEGVADGTIDAIVSGHNPKAAEKKLIEFDHAPFGMAALETTWAAIWSELVQTGRLDAATAVAALTARPAAVLGLSAGRLAVGGPADVCLVDPDASWTFTAQNAQTDSPTSPFLDVPFTGRVTMTIVDGRIVFR